MILICEICNFVLVIKCTKQNEKIFKEPNNFKFRCKDHPFKINCLDHKQHFGEFKR